MESTLEVGVPMYPNMLLEPIMVQNSDEIYITADTITRNQSITQRETIISAGGIFELGFFSPKNSSNIYLGIWYKKVSAQTVVWVSNRDYPILGSSASLTINLAGDIMISDGRMLYMVSNTSSSNNTYATLLDSGNLILRDRNSLAVLWQSFDYPTNTLLPGMKLGYDVVTGFSWYLRSWRSAQNPDLGVFLLQLDSKGDKLIIKQGSIKYWTGAATRFQLSGASTWNRTNRNGTKEFGYVTWSGDRNNSIISQIVLDVSGQLKLQSWTESAQRWYSLEASKCGISGCGAFSICNESAQIPCGCLPGFKPKFEDSWTQEPGDTRTVDSTAKGCVRKTTLNCNNDSLSEKDGFKRIEKVDFPSSPLNLDFGSALECEAASLSNCSWIAYAFDDKRQNGCLVWDNRMLDLKLLLDGDSNGRNFYLKLAASELISNESSNDPVANPGYNINEGNKRQLWVIVILTISLALLTLGFIILYMKRKLKRKGEDLLLFDLGMSLKADYPELTEVSKLGKRRKKEVKLPLFSFASVSVATNNFSARNKLGEGGFGPVFKGILLKGDEIAVKRLSRRSGQGWEEFKNEAVLISKLQHNNLVRLLGCCIERDEKILIYEYMPNKSLDFFLFDQTKCKLLDWGIRVRIIKGIAQGLLYLHQYSRLRIIHRDLKASNILLDKDMNPKISDFGLARIFGGIELQANTNRIVGTYGYMSPEYALEGIFSIKSDVFSFGVLLLEIVSGKKNTGFYQTTSFNLLGYAWDMWTSGTGLDLMDPVLEDESTSRHMLLRYANIGLLCVQESAEDRPGMPVVVSMLTSESVILPSPKQPAFSNVRSTVNSKSSISRQENCSVNNLTVSIMEAR